MKGWQMQASQMGLLLFSPPSAPFPNMVGGSLTSLLKTTTGKGDALVTETQSVYKGAAGVMLALITLQPLIGHSQHMTVFKFI